MAEVVLRSRYVMAGGVKTHYSEAGDDGPTIILLHGGGAGSSGDAGFGKTLLILGQKFRTIAIDSVGGYGGTDPYAPVPLGIQSRVDHLADFVDALCLGKFAIGGNSQGAWAAAQYALLYPKRVTKLLMVASATMTRAFGIKGEVTVGQKVLQSYDGTRAHMKKLLKALIMDPDKITDELIDMRQKSASRPGAAEARKAFQQGSNEYMANPDQTTPFSMAGRLDNIGIPTTFVWGENDAFAPPEIGKLLEPLLPNTPFHWIPNANHQAQNDQPDVVGKIMMDFFSA
jgi:pimeloyl-ACP methyl ester carboxylesterase